MNELINVPGVLAAGPSRHIISIYPGYPGADSLSHEIAVGRGFHRFVLPEAPRGEWRSLRIDNSFQWQKDFSQVGEGGSDSPGMIQVIQPATIVANALVAMFAATQHGSLGVAVLPEDIPLPERGSESPAFKSFFERLTVSQTAVFRALISEANDFKQKGKENNINDRHRMAADWIYGTGAKQLAWFEKAEFQALKPCPGCREEIVVAALHCKHCTLDLVEYYTNRGVILPGEDPAVERELKIRESAKKPGKPASPAEHAPEPTATAMAERIGNTNPGQQIRK